MFDYFIRNGFVIDGISPEPLRKNIGISGDKISYLGKEDHKAHKILDVEGLFVTPGFIDVHGHSEFNILLDGRAEGKLLQGITTEINGNCGFSAAPLYGEAFKRRDEELQYLGIQERWHDLKGYFKILLSKKIGLNFVTLCGHSNLRGSVIGYDDKPADGRALQKMKALYHHSLKSGACGFSTGLVYPPGMYSDTKEIVEILKNPMDRSVIYTSHIRSESENLLEAIEEIIKVGKETSVKVHISHLKTSERQNWSKIDKVIQLLESAREEGIGITADSYPYIASSTDLDSILPSWVFSGGLKEEIRRLRDPQASKKIKAELSLKGDDYWDNVYISSTRNIENKWMEGKSLSEIALTVNKDVVELVLDLIVSENAATEAIFFIMNEDNLKKILSLPYVMVGTDSSARSFSGPTFHSKPHPRGFGTFPRFISVYVRDEKIINLPEAIRRVTSLPARTFSIEKRGLLKEGFFADIVIFDYYRLKDRASYTDPFQSSEGIEYLFVNGQLSIERGKVTGVLAGRILV